MARYPIILLLLLIAVVAAVEPDDEALTAGKKPKPNKCPPLKPGKHAVRVKGGKPRKQLVFKCRDGFIKISGAEKHKCGRNGKWAPGNPLVCGCRPLKPGKNAKVKQNTGHKLIFVCKKGFIPKGGDESHTCGKKGKWISGKVLQCGCGPLKPGKNAMVHDNDGHTLKFVCKKGFVPKGGVATHKCGKGGQWIPGKVLQCGCGPLKPGKNAMVDANDGHTLTFTCKKGFVPKGGVAKHKCGKGGKWIPGKVLQCGCGPLKAGKNAMVHKNDGHILTFTCKKGFVPKGGVATHKCGKGGKWIPGKVLQCGCGPLKPGKNAMVDVNDGHKLTFVCKKGFVPKGGVANHKCGKGGKWIPGKVLQCGCGPLDPGKNADVKLNNGHKLMFACQKGFVPKGGDESHTCGKGGKWISGKVLVCGCGPLSPGKNAMVDKNDGHELIFVCKKGFVRKAGVKKHTCGKGGKWNPGKVLICRKKKKSCRPAPKVEHAKRKCRFKPKKGNPPSCTYKCKGKRVLNKEHLKTIICVRGKWSRAPKCVKKKCRPIPKVKNSLRKCQLKKKVPRCTFKCKKGFRMKKKAFKHILCFRGTWSPTPKCVRKRGGGGRGGRGGNFER